MTATTSRPPPDEPGRRLGVFGGSFDPVHLGHLHVARTARQAFELDHVLFVPAARPPHKPGRRLASPEDRVRMLELALEGDASASIWTVELERDGPSYTVDTLREARRRWPTAELHLVLGWDSLEGLERWRAAAEVLTLAQPIVVWRESRVDGALEKLRAELGPRVAERVERGLVRAPPAPQSSTSIRDALARGEDGLPATTAAVGEYIRARGIYGDSGAR